jgi:polysaccharide export outer membrane protein
MLAVLTFGATGCKTSSSPNFSDPNLPPEALSALAQGQGMGKATNSNVIILREGDILKFTFPGAPNLNTSQQIRRDGKLALPMAGEFQAAGLTLPALEAEVLRLYGPQLQTKEVSVNLESSAFPLYITGAVLRPGKIVADRPLTVLEAIMEAGGFDDKRANLKSIRVLRQENGTTKQYNVNLRGIMQGQGGQPMVLKPSDIVYVPERFTWF